MVARRPAIEHLSVPEQQAEQQALLAAQRRRGDVAISPNGLNGTLRVDVRTDATPSPWAQDLAAALQDVQTEVDCVKALDRIEEARELHAITRTESGRLLAAARGIAVARGWLGEAGRRDLEGLLRQRLPEGPGPRA